MHVNKHSKLLNIFFGKKNEKCYLPACFSSGPSKFPKHETLSFRLMQQIIYDVLKYIKNNLIQNKT